MADPLMTQRHTGLLRVTIHTLDGYVESFTLNFQDTTLFEYIGQACACIFTNLTTQPSIRTSPDDWKTLKFTPEREELEVMQIGGEPLKIEDDDDDPDRLAAMVPPDCTLDPLIRSEIVESFN